MFSLIVTIISIALVAALAMATLHYGGRAFNQGAASAEASKILAQGQQLMAATDLYIARMGTVPTLAQLQAGGYLKSIPQASLVVGSAHAEGVAWDMPVTGQVVFLLTGVNSPVCQQVNAKMMGVDGVLEHAREGYLAQCYGPLTGHRVVLAKSGLHLQAAATANTPDFPSTDLVADALPDVSDTGAWVVPPGQIVAGGGGSTEPPEEPPEEPPVSTALEMRTFIGGPAFGPNYTFAPVSLGGSASVTFYVHNSGATPVNLGASDFTPQAGSFALPINQRQWTESRGAGCSPIPAGGSCGITLNWLVQGDPLSLSRTWTATSTDNQVLSVALSGTVLYPAPSVDVTSITASGDSFSRTVILSNAGPGTLRFTQFAQYISNNGYTPVAGQGFETNDGRYEVSDDTCFQFSGSLAAGQSCAFTIHGYSGYGAGTVNWPFTITPDFLGPITIPVSYTSPE